MVDNISWQDALSRLKKGNANFVADHLDGKLQNSSRRGELVSGQAPFAIVLSCADSRVVPELAFDTGLGELFVIRVAGNVANTSTIASIEYAVAHLGVNLIVVMGHESCGAITAALDGGDNGYNLNHLLGHVTPAMNASEDKDVNAVVKVNAHLTCKQILSRSAIIEEATKKKDIKIIPAFYNLGSGVVDFIQD
ncbi:carbonic anhydrase [Aureispira anguillae]|uniref:Carbonic anhydrase n=1 Tax=Aureispira anguillae TaxID=2864201 RepID=A0A915YH38_9BACT|nr:carbonic anhydrase [Aureispira anguillae]BDS12828.1 carbonic anhydrase [Aureispira anguillae]